LAPDKLSTADATEDRLALRNVGVNRELEAGVH